MQQPPRQQPPYGGGQPPYGGQQPPYGGQQPPRPQPPYGGQQPPYQQPPYRQQPPGGGWGAPPPSDWQPSPEDYQPPERNWLLIGGIAAAVVFCMFAILGIILIVALSGGDGEGEPTAVTNLGGPRVQISQPTAGQIYKVGDTITVQAQASDTGTGVTRVELLVNNVVVDSQTSQNPTGDKNLSVLLDYAAAVPAQNVTLTVRAYRGVVRGEDASVTVSVQDAAAAVTATPATGGTTGGGQVVIPPTFNPVCRARVNVTTLNFRRGPSTDYPSITTLSLGTEVPIVGRLGDNSWWQVTASGQTGWVSAAYTELLGNCGSVPVAAPPSSPTPVITPTLTGPQPANLIVSTLTGANNIVLTGGSVAASYILRVRNVGGTTAGAFNVTITYPSGQVSDFTIAALAPGQEADVPGVTATFTTPGVYRLAILVDSSGNITESNKTDNTAFLDITVTLPTPTPEGQ